MVIICGVEEAGRGPVIGPMVMAGVVMDEKDLFKLDDLGVRDSKLLSPFQRESMFELIQKAVKAYKIITLPPSKIDETLDSEDMNLNWLEAKTSAEIINELNPDKAILDCPSNNILAYSIYVKNNLSKPVEIISEHKADLNHKIVGAASILAKVARDREIQKIKDKLKVNFGSGYPSDPLTIKFLKDNWNKYPDIFRKSWSSYKRVESLKSQKKLAEF
ncbi:MAG: ribonuclease HII [Candidatus Woesearchaeota archaeon]